MSFHQRPGLRISNLIDDAVAAKHVSAYATLIAAMIGLSLFAAPAQAQSIGAAYYLYQQGTGVQGPCVDRIGRYQGEVAIPNHSYRWKSDGSAQEGNIQSKYYWDQGFNRAHRYNGCSNGAFVYRYYGANSGKIRRRITTVWAGWGGVGSHYLYTYEGRWRWYRW